MAEGKSNAVSGGAVAAYVEGKFIRNSTRPATLYYSDGDEQLEVNISSSGSGDEGEEVEIPVQLNSIIAISFQGTSANPPTSGAISLITAAQGMNLYFVTGGFVIDWQQGGNMAKYINFNMLKQGGRQALIPGRLHNGGAAYERGRDERGRRRRRWAEGDSEREKLQYYQLHNHSASKPGSSSYHKFRQYGLWFIFNGCPTPPRRRRTACRMAKWCERFLGVSAVVIRRYHDFHRACNHLLWNRLSRPRLTEALA